MPAAGPAAPPAQYHSLDVILRGLTPKRSAQMSHSRRSRREQPSFTYRPTRPPQSFRRYRQQVLDDPFSFRAGALSRPVSFTPTVSVSVPDLRRWTFDTHPLAIANQRVDRSVPSSQRVEPRHRAYRDVTLKGIGARLGFAAPAGVAECLRRKTRREVLLALGKGNGRAPKRQRALSQISC